MSIKYSVKTQCWCGVNGGSPFVAHTGEYPPNWAEENWREGGCSNGLLVRGLCRSCWSPFDKGADKGGDEWGCVTQMMEAKAKGQLFSMDGYYATQRRIARCPKFLYPQFKMEAAFNKVAAEINKHKNNFGMWRPSAVLLHYKYDGRVKQSVKDWAEKIQKKQIGIHTRGSTYNMRDIWRSGEDKLHCNDKFIARVYDDYHNRDIRELMNDWCEFRNSKERYFDTYRTKSRKEAIKWVEFGALYDVCIEKDKTAAVSLCDDVLSVIREYVV